MIIHTIMNPIKPLFFEHTLQRWHFEAIVKASKLSRERVHHFLKELCKEEFIQRHKPKSRMPYYEAHRDSPKFRSEKRIYGLVLLEESGLFEHVSSRKEITTAILFGSFARGDWGKSSDIDLFLFGDDHAFEKHKFESILHREIQLFSYKNRKDIKHQLDPKVIPQIIKGFHINNSIEPFMVGIHG